MEFECDCGAVMEFCEEWNGIAYRPVFKTEGGEITHCPRCGEYLYGVYCDRKYDTFQLPIFLRRPRRIRL